MERPTVDALLVAEFPNARFTRQERGDHWGDQLDLHWLRIRVQVFPETGAFRVNLLGVRTGIDGSSTALWSLLGEGEDQLKNALGQLRAELLGAAQGIVRITGRVPESPSLEDLML
jgi:hypothetical protein